MSKFTSLTRKLAVFLAVLIPVFFAGASLGTKFGLWDWRFGFGKLTVGYGPKLMMLTAIVAFIALLFSLVVKPRKGILSALLCLAVPIIGMGYGQKMRTKARSLPFIHDITTDRQNPPTFTDTIIKRRAACKNGLEYIGTTVGKDKKLVSDLQASGYPDIKSLHYNQSPKIVFDKAVKALKMTGLAAMSANKDTGVLEATATSFWFGFTDDVVIRIHPDADGSLVDIRSVSCVGMSDVGVNAARIRKIRDTLNGLLKS